MDDIKLLAERATDPEIDEKEKRRLFGLLVAHFQDMAYGYAFAMLADTDLAEEAAQEAFVEAWQKLAQLQNPRAFPGWFKRIVFTKSYRLQRTRQIAAVSLDDLTALRGVDNPEIDPQAALEKSEFQTEVRTAIGGLPTGERDAVVLFYINEYSREEIAAFLGISALAVKKRLASARRRLKQRMIHMVQDNLHNVRPSRNDEFAGRVLAFSQEFSSLLRSGTPILKTLELCASAQKDNPQLQNAIIEMREEVLRGGSLRNAMAHYPDLFNDYYMEAVCFGEEDGTLDIILERLARGEKFDSPEKLQEFKREMKERHKV